MEWRIDNRGECDACRGKGTLGATGQNGQRYRVECPECCGDGTVEGDDEFVKTDIDGHLLQRAA